jgi:hypothetical protein
VSDHVRKTIADLQRHLQDLMDEASDTKRTINSLCKTIGDPPLYKDADKKSVATIGPVRPDQYYGKALATVAREILEARQATNLGPASVAELYDKMVEGGYQFDTTNVDNAKRVLRISLAKNTATFHKLPGGTYGLREWYPAIKDKKKNGKPSDDSEEPDDDEAAEGVTVGAASEAGESEAEMPRKPR